MKKIVSILLAAMMIFGVLSVTSFAEDTKTYTEKFVDGIKDGFGVNLSRGSLNLDASVKDDMAGFKLSIAGINAKVVMKGSEITAYILPPLFKANVSEIVRPIIGEIKVSDITSGINAIPDISNLVKYCKVDAKAENGTITEKFTPDAEKAINDLKPIIANKAETPELKEMIMGFDANAFIEYCNALPDGENNGKKEFDNAMAIKAEVVFTDDGNTVKDFSFVIPNEDFTEITEIKMADINIEGIKINSITINVNNDAFNATGIFDITWLVKLLTNFILDSITAA